MLQGNSGTSKNKDTSLWTFAQNSGVKKVSPRQVDAVVNETRRRFSLWITPTTVD